MGHPVVKERQVKNAERRKNMTTSSSNSSKPIENINCFHN
jgi:hypothetical protein